MDLVVDWRGESRCRKGALHENLRRTLGLLEVVVVWRYRVNSLKDKRRQPSGPIFEPMFVEEKDILQ